MILVATHAYAVGGIVLEDALWNIPAAICYQLDLIFAQRAGYVFKRDTQADILKELS